jgi:DNA-3-methyladenine glycosylase
MARIGRSFFDRDVDVVARQLIGTTFMVDGVGGVIVETESYDATDPASHSFGMRQAEWTASMFGPPGHAHVYKVYGLHWCLNFVRRVASAVLIRAIEPKYGNRTHDQAAWHGQAGTALFGARTVVRGFGHHQIS